MIISFSQTPSLAMEQSPPPDPKQQTSSKMTTLLHSVKLPKKTSIPSLFMASSASIESSSTSRVPAFSLLNKPTDTSYEPPLPALPPPSLLDDDPFANLPPHTIPQPSHFLASCDQPSLSQVSQPSIVVVSPQVNMPRPKVVRPRSSGHGQVRPACTRPACAPRPSLPSLHTLAQMNVSVPGRKIRKGTPGARLPHEPWDMDLSTECSLLMRGTPSSTGPADSQPQGFPAPTQETVAQTVSLPTTGNSETCFGFREIAVNSLSLTDETSSSRSLSGDDADTDSLPSLSYTTSEPSSSTLSRSSSIATSSRPEGSMDINSSREPASMTLHVDDGVDEADDPLSYSDFDYYTQSLSDPSDSDPDLDLTTASEAKHSSSPLDAGVTPYNSVYDSLVDFEPGTSADTMRRISVPRGHTQAEPHVVGLANIASPQDGNGWRGQRSEPERLGGGEDGSRGRESNRRSGGRSRGSYEGGAGDSANHKDEAHRSKPRSPESSTPDYTSSSDDDADCVTVYYSLDGMSNGSPPRAQSRTYSRHSKAGGGSDDDVPLAQRVPTALSAQKSIRKQLHDERQQRRLERAKSSRAAAEPRPTESLHLPAAPARFRKRSISAAPAPASSSRITSTEAFPAEELTRKLMNLPAVSRSPPSTAPLTYDSSLPIHTSPPRAPVYSTGVSRSPSRVRNIEHATYLPHKTSRVPEAPPQDRPLRPMRSFHRPDGRFSETQRSPNEQGSGPRVGHSATIATVRAGRDAALVGHEQYVKSGRGSEDGRKPSAGVSRLPIDKESDIVQRTIQRPPVPPLPVSDSTPPHHVTRGTVVQQRIFIGDMQRFKMVEILPTTNAGDVINTVASQGMLDRSGSWMLFEVAQDYGMERPIRDYEVLADVSASWNKDKLLNAFIIKQTPLAPLLSRSAIPTSSPTHRGWVEWESKRGKWSKRWMELREHGLWLSKRDTGKDEVFLCSVSSFDAYFVTRRHKSPKPFVFAIKSTDHPSLFENAADYLHVFSCNSKDGERWMQAILIARSYVLYQERHVLFTKTGEALSQVKPLARSRTRKQSVSSRPAQPLVSVPPPFSQSLAATITFEPGSLLAKRKGDAQP